MAAFQFADECDAGAEDSAPAPAFLGGPDYSPRLPQPGGERPRDYRGFLARETAAELAATAASGAALEQLGAPETARAPGLGGILLILAALYALS